MYGAKHFGLANVQTSYNGATISRTFFMMDNGRVGIADVIKSTSPHTYTWQLHGNGIIDGSVQQGNATVTIDTNKAMGVWNVNKSKLFAQVSGTHFTNARAEHAVHETRYNDTAEHTVLRCDTRKSTRGSFGAILTTSIDNEIPQFDIYNSDQYTSYTHQQNDTISDVFFVRDTTGTDNEIIYNGPFSSITTDAECGYLQYENYRGTALLFNVASGYIPLIAYFESDKNVSLAMSTVEGTKQFLNGYVNQPCKIFFRPSAWIPEYGYKLTNVSGDSIESVHDNFIKFKGASTFQFGWLATYVRDEEHNIQILPNPIQDVVHISLTDNEVQKVEFIDVLGNTALTTQHNNATAVHVSVQSLPVGMYHVRITTSTGLVTKQVIVAR